MQDLTGLDLGMIGDPDAASVHLLVQEAVKGHAGGVAFEDKKQQGGGMNLSPWISPAPITIKMRLFCLPYAGGVSENVFGRYANECPKTLMNKYIPFI